MILIDLIKYFAKFPSKEGVLNTFVRGESSMPLYQSLKADLESLPEACILPGIERFVVASSLDKVKVFVSSFIGYNTFLMLDYGEISSIPDAHNAIQDQMRLAVTVACHLEDSADLMEENIASSVTLELVNELRAHIMADSRMGRIGNGIQNLIAGAHQLVPFESKDLQSIGWTIAFSLDATDLLDVSGLSLQYSKL